MFSAITTIFCSISCFLVVLQGFRITRARGKQLIRDYDYIRNMLIEFEASDEWFMIVALYVGASSEQEKKFAHCELLVDAGFFQRYENHAYRMTSKGYDFVHAIRNDDDWMKTKELAASVGGGTLEILKDISMSLLKHKIPETVAI